MTTMDGNPAQWSHLPLRDRIFMGSTFLPVDRPVRSALLLEEVARERQAALAVIAMKLRSRGRDELAQPLIDQLGQSLDARRALVNSPELRVWLKHAIRALALDRVGASPVSTSKLDQLTREFLRLQDLAKRDCVRVPGTGIRLQGRDVDPLIKAALPPGYQLAIEQDRADQPLALAGDAIARALARIADTWPALREDISRYVLGIIHLGDVELRSCSGEPYTGVIVLTNTDDAPFGLEESIVREYSHQVLYNVMELSPLLTDAADAEPERRADVHELFVSISLALYFERIRYRPERHLRQIAQRLRSLTVDSLDALAQFDAADLRARGQQLLTQLAAQVELLAARQRISAPTAAPPRLSSARVVGPRTLEPDLVNEGLAPSE